MFSDFTIADAFHIFHSFNIHVAIFTFDLYLWEGWKTPTAWHIYAHNVIIYPQISSSKYFSNFHISPALSTKVLNWNEKHTILWTCDVKEHFLQNNNKKSNISSRTEFTLVWEIHYNYKKSTVRIDFNLIQIEMNNKNKQRWRIHFYIKNIWASWKSLFHHKTLCYAKIIYINLGKKHIFRYSV